MQRSWLWFLCLCLIFGLGCSKKRSGGHCGSFSEAAAASKDVVDDGSGGGEDGDDDDSDDGDDGGGGGGDDEPPAWPPADCDYSMVDENWRPDEHPVWYFNSRFYGDHTARWKNGAIKVKVLDARVNLEALQSTFDELNQLIEPAVLVIFNGPVDNAQILIDYAGALPPNTGFSVWEVDPDKGRITAGWVGLADYAGADCYFYAIIKHHLIRTLGIFDYTQDGGVMAQEFRNDLVTAIIIETLLGLYDLKPDSEVGPNGPVE